MVLSLFILLALVVVRKNRDQPDNAASPDAPSPEETTREQLSESNNPSGFDRKALRQQIAAASEIYEAMKGGLWGIGVDEQTVLRTLRDNVQQIDQVRKHYNDHFEGRDFDTDVLFEVSEASRPQAEALLNGDLAGAEQAGLEAAPANSRESSNPAGQVEQSLSELEKLHAALTEAKDVKAVENIFANKSSADAAALINDYSDKYNTNYYADIDNNFAGRNSFDVRMASRGQAQSAEEEVSRLREKQDFERSGVGSLIVDTISSRGAVLDRTVTRAEEALAGAAVNGDAVSAARVSELAQYGGHDAVGYAEAKDSAAELTAATAAGIAGAGAVALSGGAATPLVVGALAAGGGAATYTGTKMVVEGNSYELTAGNVATDMTSGAVEGIATASGMKAAKALAQGYSGLSAVVIESAVDNSLSSGISEGGNAIVRGDGVGETAKAVALGSTIGAVLGTGGGAGSHSLVHGVGKGAAHELEDAVTQAAGTAERAVQSGEVAATEAIPSVGGSADAASTVVAPDAVLPRSVQNALDKTKQVDEALATGDTKQALLTMQRVEESLGNQIDTLAGKGEGSSLGAANLHRATGDIALKRAALTGDVEQYVHASDAYLESLRSFSLNGAPKSEINATEMGLIRARDGMRAALAQLDNSEAGLTSQAMLKSELARSRMQHGIIANEPRLFEQSVAEFDESAALYLQVDNMDASMSARRAGIEANAALARMRETPVQLVEPSPVDTLAQVRASEAARGPLESVATPDTISSPRANEASTNGTEQVGRETAVYHPQVESTVTSELRNAVASDLDSYSARLAQKTGLSVLDEMRVSVQTGHVDGFMNADMNARQLSYGSRGGGGTRPTITIGLGLDDAEAGAVRRTLDYGFPHEMSHLIDEKLGELAEQGVVKRGLSDLALEDVAPVLRSVEEQLPSFPGSDSAEIKRQTSNVLALQLRETYYDGMGLNLAGTYGVTDPGVSSVRGRTEAVAEALLATENIVPWQQLPPGDVGRIAGTANLLREVARTDHMIDIAKARGLEPELIERLQGLRDRRLEQFTEANTEFGYFTDEATTSMLDGMKRTFNEGLQAELSPRWAVGSLAGKLLSSGGAADPASYAEQLVRQVGNAPREELARWYPGGDRYESMVRVANYNNPAELERWLDVSNPAIDERVGQFFARSRNLTPEGGAAAVNDLREELRNAGWNPE